MVVVQQAITMDMVGNLAEVVGIIRKEVGVMVAITTQVMEDRHMVHVILITTLVLEVYPLIQTQLMANLRIMNQEDLLEEVSMRVPMVIIHHMGVHRVAAITMMKITQIME